MPGRFRLLPLLACFAVALVALTGCGSEPSRAQAAAVVGDQTISIDDIQGRLRAVAPVLQDAVDQRGGVSGQPGAPVPNALLAQESRRLLTVRLLHELIGDEARREGIVADPAQVDAAVAAAGGVPAAARRARFDEATTRDLFVDQVLAVEIGRRSFDRLTVTADSAEAPDRASADSLAARVAADPSQARALLSAGGQGQHVTVRPGADSAQGVSQTASSPLFGVPLGTVAVISAASSGSSSQADPATQPWAVVYVSSRTFDAALPSPGVTPVEAVDPSTLFAFGVLQVQASTTDIPVTVSPRYGAWDPTQLSVVESPAAAGTITPVRTAAP